MDRRTLLPLLPAALLLLQACEREIEVDLPRTEPKVVVEGVIQTGQPPLVILSRTQNFFDPTSLQSIAASFISEAAVTVFDGSTTHTLDRICSSLIPDSLLAEVAAITGINVNLLANANICAWTRLDGSLLGEEGRSYRLEVQTEGKAVSATTTIPQTVELDSVWFRLALQRPNDDTLGLMWGRLSDPDTLGNCYRVLAQRINRRPNGQPKDANFVAPFFSVFDDRYFNGLSFDFNFNRGAVPFSTALDDNNEERGFFKVGDTVVVKGVSIDLASFRFYNSFQNNVATQGDVFSNPANVMSNIQGGIGIWSGWAYRLDTVVCVP